MKAKRFAAYRGTMLPLCVGKSVTFPKELIEEQDFVRVVLAGGEAYIDHNDEMWVEVDGDGYYSTYQQVIEAHGCNSHGGH